MCVCTAQRHERPRDRFDREERFLLQPLTARRYISLILDRPPTSTPTRRSPRPVVTVEKRPLATYAQLAAVPYEKCSALTTRAPAPHPGGPPHTGRARSPRPYSP